MPEVPNLTIKEQRDTLQRGITDCFAAMGVRFEELNVTMTNQELMARIQDHCSDELTPRMFILASFGMYVLACQCNEAEQN